MGRRFVPQSPHPPCGARALRVGVVALLPELAFETGTREGLARSLRKT